MRLSVTVDFADELDVPSDDCRGICWEASLEDGSVWGSLCSGGGQEGVREREREREIKMPK